MDQRSHISPRFRRRPRRNQVVLLLLSLVALACSPKHPTTPNAALERYASAIKAEDWQRAYNLLSEADRAELSFEQFKDIMSSNKREVASLLDRVQSHSSPPLVTAKVHTRSGDVLTLVYQDGAWRLDASAFDLYSQRDPRQTLASFVRAYDHQRYDVLLRFVPKKELDGLTTELLKQAWQGSQKVEIEQIVEGLRVSYSTAKLEVLGDRATMSYGSGAAVELTLEDGSWKIENFQ